MNQKDLKHSKLSSQARAAIVMVFQKGIMEAADMSAILSGLMFLENDLGELVCLNPPTIDYSKIAKPEPEPELDEDDSMYFYDFENVKMHKDAARSRPAKTTKTKRDDV